METTRFILDYDSGTCVELMWNLYRTLLFKVEIRPINEYNAIMQIVAYRSIGFTLGLFYESQLLP